MRKSNLIWGIIILVVGFIFLADNLGIFPAGIHAWQVVFPAALIILGLWFLVAPTLFKHEDTAETVAIPLDGARSAEVTILHGVGRLVIAPLVTSSDLLSGEFSGGVEKSVQRDGDTARLNLRAPMETAWGFPFLYASEGFSWNFGLSRLIPLKLELKTGASENRIDLTDCQVTDIHLGTGASSTNLTLPAHSGFTRVAVDSGAAAVKVNIPEGVAATIRVESGLAGININPQRFPNVGGRYESPDYNTAANKAEIFIKTGVGSVDIR